MLYLAEVCEGEGVESFFWRELGEVAKGGGVFSLDAVVGVLNRDLATILAEGNEEGGSMGDVERFFEGLTF